MRPAWPGCAGVVFGRVGSGVFCAPTDGGPSATSGIERLDELFASGKMAGFLEHKLPTEDSDVAAYGFVKDLMASSNKFSSLIVALRGGEEFETAFARIFGRAAESGGYLGAFGEAAVRSK